MILNGLVPRGYEASIGIVATYNLISGIGTIAAVEGFTDIQDR